MNLEEFSTECGAYAQRYQQALDALYEVGCKYNITCEDMRPLCDHAGVAFDDLMKHNGNAAAKSAALN